MADPCPTCQRPRDDAYGGGGFVVRRCHTCPGDELVRAPDVPVMVQVSHAQLAAWQRAERHARAWKACATRWRARYLRRQEDG